ncbi:FMN-binding glutamate synthase family protein [Algimonas arctica]|uniref:FMN-binding glutamate synthase family protein n=1 Tax=Algimonas arctica TaxID=1479486 RepID=A0A8J3CR59_9PROT|nr:FMN-binding glutamate synthase family protein [Algimonas arctica]GHA97059.1 FMN-binding glutamate synthase family protein [Algimonas arctica]
MDTFAKFAMSGLELLGSLFLFTVGLLLIGVVVLFIHDKTQRKNAIWRNYPVVGHFRNLFQVLGEFFRQYFFAQDREEMPFNRAERDWVGDVCEDGKDVVPFGSTKVYAPGMPIFANGLFPKLDEEEVPARAPFTIGPDTPHPYRPSSFFNISAMSYGSLSAPAVQALSRGAKLAGCYLNTGEGGVSPYHLEGDCDIVYQLGTAKFGARNEDSTLNEAKLAKICENPNIKMIEIKLSQGAKPGKGGILPAKKVTKEIADIRDIPEGEAALSPNRHVDAANPEELLDLIDQVRRVSKRPVGIKFCMGQVKPVQELLDTIIRRGVASAPDYIVIDSGDGGTGAAPMPLIDSTGMLIEDSLPLLHDMLIDSGLRDRIKIIASGKLITSADVAWAFCVGADMINNARGFMFALGCIQALKCDKNTCPTGITTHDKRLQRGLDPTNKAVRVRNYVKTLNDEVAMIAHACGVDCPRDLTREHLLVMQASGRTRPFTKVWNPDRYLSSKQS